MGFTFKDSELQDINTLKRNFDSLANQITESNKMTPAEREENAKLKRQIEAIAAYRDQNPPILRDLNAAPRDIADALGDVLAIRAGLSPTDPHPLAGRLAFGRSARPIGEIAAAVCGLDPDKVSTVEIRASLNSSDFGDAIKTAATHVAALDFSRQAAEWQGVCLDVQTKGTKPIALPSIEIGELKRISGHFGPDGSPLLTVDAAQSVRPAIHSAHFLVSREMDLSDESVEIISAIVRQLNAHATHLIPRTIAAAITANKLASGDALFSAANTTTATGLDATALGAAISKLRSQTTPAGSVANTTPEVLMVHPDKEFAARVLVASATPGSSAPLLRVLANPWLQNNDSFLLSDPQSCAAFVRARPAGFPDMPSIERVSSSTRDANGNMLSYDGSRYKYEFIVGIAAVNAQGIIRIPA